MPKKTSLFEQAEIQKQNLNLINNSNKSKKSEFNITLKAIGCSSSQNSSKSYTESLDENKSESLNCSLPNDEFNFENLDTFKKSFNMLSSFYDLESNNNYNICNSFIEDNKKKVFSPKVKSSFLKSRNSNLFKLANNDTSTHKQVFMNVKSKNLQEVSFSFDNNDNDDDNNNQYEENVVKGFANEKKKNFH